MHSRFDEARIDLAIELLFRKAFLTFDMDHPRVIEREGFVGKERGFELAHHRKHPDDPLSPYYFDLRTPENGGPLTWDTIKRAARCMRGLLDAEEVRGFGAVIGVAHAGDPFADALAYTYGEMPRLAHPKENGEKREPYAARGKMPLPGTNVLVVDDVIASGGSKIPTIECVRRAGFAVTDVAVLIDREEGGTEKLYEMYDRKLHVHAVFPVSKLVAIYNRTDRIEKEVYEKVVLYVNSFK